ncbi:tetratricopeptide repeat protein [Lacinutrix neustonica]|uniref:tetratricopeptide repeat protein n=1 Tax=Lacinutrix neustonica TaxID=2980107 RepID=UPI0028BF512C|nr:cell surface protein [Lacinutrix neustonica]
MKTTIYSLLVLLLFGCTTKIEKLTKAEDYEVFLIAENTALTHAKTDHSFWTNKLEKTPNQFPYLAKLAGTQTQLFSTTGEINYLIQAENSLKQLNEKTDYNKSSYLRALARNYISQHRFKEALILLEKAEILSEDLESTQKMLFDVHMELGNNEKAKYYLERIVDLKSFDFLIRTAKWNDHKGNLTAAIKYMEQAMAKAEASKIKSTMQWAYTNIADFYGHDGQIQKSYDYFLKALALNPNDAYAKRGIAWIVYSYENNPEEALRILNNITTSYNAPDYYLLKAEIAEYLKDDEMKESYLELYAEAVKNKQYGDMYNAYNVEVFAEKNPIQPLLLQSMKLKTELPHSLTIC